MKNGRSNDAYDTQDTLRASIENILKKMKICFRYAVFFNVNFFHWLFRLELFTHDADNGPDPLLRELQIFRTA